MVENESLLGPQHAHTTIIHSLNCCVVTLLINKTK